MLRSPRLTLCYAGYVHLGIVVLRVREDSLCQGRVSAATLLYASYLMNTPSMLLKLCWTPLSKTRQLSYKRPL